MTRRWSATYLPASRIAVLSLLKVSLRRLPRATDSILRILRMYLKLIYCLLSSTRTRWPRTHLCMHTADLIFILRASSFSRAFRFNSSISCLRFIS